MTVTPPLRDGVSATGRGLQSVGWALPVAFPFLVAAAPLLYLWSKNAATVTVAQVVPVLAILLVATAVAVVGLTIATRDVLRSAVSVAAVWLPLLTFGYQLDALDKAPSPQWHELVVVIGDSIVALAIVAAAWRWNAERPARFVAVVAAIFIASTLPGLLPVIATTTPVDQEPRATGEGPDIYYIILDAYGRADVLDEVYDYDNEPFLSGLRERGFYVADQSYSNYAMTHLSLASSLTMDYLSTRAPYDVPSVARLIQDAPAIEALLDRGYRYVHFETEWFLTAQAPLADIVFRRGGFSSEFERAFFKTTLPGRLLPPPPRHEAVLDTLAELREVPTIDGPTFTFVHLLVPHPPFMFSEDGTVIPYVDEIAGSFAKEPYANQLSYVNDEITELVDDLVSGSDERPVIIVQGDHGPALTILTNSDRSVIEWERLAILNALLVPKDVRAQLYPSISPVNTFRVLLRVLFGVDLPNLPDRSFYNWYDAGSPAAIPGDELQLQDVTGTLP